MTLPSPHSSRLIFTLGVLAAVSFTGFAIWSRFPVPYRDDWDWLAWVVDGPVTLARLFQVHNEHLIPLPRLLMSLQYWLEGADGQLLFWLALACQATIVALFLHEIAARWREAPDTRRLTVGLSLLLLCFAWQMQSIVFIAAILFPLVQLGAALAVAAAIRAADAAGQARAWWLVAAHIASLGAMLTTTNGLAVPVTLAVLAFGMRQSHAVIASHVAAAVIGGIFFYAWVLLPGLPDLPKPVPDAHAGTILAYFAAFFAPFVAYFHPIAAAVVGSVFPIAGGGLIAWMVLGRRSAPRIEWFSAGLLLFVIGTAILAAVGRASFGVDQAAQSRYATYTQVYWTALLVLLVSLAARSGPSSWLARLAPMARRAALPFATTLMAAHVLSGLVWMAKADHVAAAGVALRADVPDEAWLTVLHPHPSVIGRVQELIRGDHDRRLIDDWIGRRITLKDSTPACDASVALTAVDNPGGPTWRLHGDVHAAVTRGLIVDETGDVVGLAQPAPLVDVPDTSRAAVTNAVRAALVTGQTHATRWFGFARHTGTAYRFVAMASDGTPLCVTGIQ